MPTRVKERHCTPAIYVLESPLSGRELLRQETVRAARPDTLSENLRGRNGY